MIKVEKATAAMYEDVCQLFYMGEKPAEWEARVKQFFYPLFHCAWNRAEEKYGHALLKDGKVIGFLGAFHGTRLIRGRQERFCNLASWFVVEKHRNDSLRLVAPYLALKEHTITLLTPAPHVYQIFRRFHFKDLDTKVAIIPILSAFPGSHHGCDFADQPAQITAKLTDNEQKLFNDHQGYYAFHLLAHDDRGHCLITYTLTQKKGCKMAYVHHLSDKVFFQAHLAAIAWAIFRRHGALFVCVEDRHLHDPRPWLKKYYHLRAPRAFKSATVAPVDVDNLYTELIASDVFSRYFY